MSEDKAIDYNISYQDAKELLGAVVLPHEFRLMVLQKYKKDHGTAALIELFSQFIGMANSVVANNRDSLEMFLIVEKGWHPYQAEKMNLPTVFGALQGIALADGIDQSKTCHGCAARVGTLANQSPSTTCDLKYVLDCDHQFMCHEELDEKGNPVRKCRGYTQLRRNLNKIRQQEAA